MSSLSVPLRRPFADVDRTAARRPRWERPALAGVLALAALLCLWHLTISGYSNEYYAAAAKSASVSWKAWFFGSLDPGSFITVDKPPLSIWLMGLSARVLGFGSFSILLPQALATIAAVALLHATVKRVTGSHAAGLIAAAFLATTPVTVAIARVSNPDALMVLLTVAAAYMTVRAIEAGRLKHLVWAGAFVGLAFMTKMLQGWMVIPALGAAYLLAAPAGLGTRVRHLAVAFATTCAVSAAWPLAVTLWPGSKPYIGGSTDGGVWDLILGYNGLGRILGQGGGGGGASFGGEPGLLRLLNDQVGGQAAWLLPLAALGLIGGLVLTRRAARTDPRRAGVVLFGTWAVVQAAVFSLAQGTFHPYYVSALAPAIAALAAIGVVLLGGHSRRSLAATAALAAGVAGTAAVGIELLGRTPDYAAWLRPAIAVAAGVTVAALFAVHLARSRALLATAAVAAAFAVLAGPTAYSVANLGRSLDGNNVIAGPASATSLRGGFGGGGPGGGGSPPGGGQAQGGGGPGAGGGQARAAGTSGTGSVSSELIAYLEESQGSAKYLVAVFGASSSEQLIIQTGKAVVTIGGFTGSDPAPTVGELAAMVASGELKYVLTGGGGRGSSELSAWIEEHGTEVTDAGTTSGTLYALTA